MRNDILTRDDFAKLLFTADFFPINSAFNSLQPTVQQCQTDYAESAKKSSCGCGGDTTILFGCIDTMLARMEQFRAENPAALHALLEYIRNKRNKPNITSFTLYYRKTGQEPLRKIQFP